LHNGNLDFLTFSCVKRLLPGFRRRNIMNARTLFSALITGASSLALCQTIISTNGFGNVAHNTYQGATSQTIAGQGVLLNMPVGQGLLKIDLPQGSNWSAYTHLEMDIKNSGATTEPIFVAVASTGIWCYTEIVIRPGVTARVVMPFDNVGTEGAHRLPQPPGTTYNQIYAGLTVDKPNVVWLMVQAPNAKNPTSFLMSNMKPVTITPATTNYVDKYGQQNQITWKGKIRQDSDLNAAIARHPISGNYPYAADIYGGVLGTAQAGSATGYWHTAKQGSKWYIIDPLGNRFFSSGVVHAGKPTPALVAGHEPRFAADALPSQTGPFAEHYTTGYDGFGNPYLTFNFNTSNIQRRVGSNWKAELLNTTKARMRTWAFNTAGSESHHLLQEPGAQTPFADTVTVSGNFAKIPDPYCLVHMPDVYDPAWQQALQDSLAPKTTLFANNPYSLGLFVENELPWAFPYSSVVADYGLAIDILNTGATQPAKIAFVNWLKQRYSNNIGALNAGWLTSWPSFDAMLNSNLGLIQTVPVQMGTDMREFTLIFARKYFTTVRQKLTQLGYTGMYLGSRFLYYTAEVLQAAKESCDVLSFNGYDLAHNALLKNFDAPALVSEFGYGACDLGRLPSYPNLITEFDRADAYRIYGQEALQWPNLVGFHWYKWDDDVASGRFYDGNNVCMGLVSITDIPYWDTVTAATEVNLLFHNRLLNP
jgi:hypothetical protein